MPRSFAPLTTLASTFSKAYSGVCTPMTSKPLSRYASYHPTTCGIARWQLMHEYAQKSMSTTLPRNDFRSIGAFPGVLSHLVMPLMSGAVPQLSSSEPPSEQFDRWAFCSLTRPPRLSSTQLFVAADLFLQAAGVVGYRALQGGRKVEDQRHGQQDRHDACGDADLALPAAERRHSLGHALAREREEQQRKRRADGEGQRQRHRVEPDGSGGPRDDDGREHRSRARHVQHAEGQPEPESASAGAELLLRQLRERLLQERLELREDQPEADGDQRDERDPADRVLGQMQQRQQSRPEQA